MYKNFIKRFIDLIIAVLLFIIFFPLFVCISIALIVTNHGSPFFIQPRPGKNGNIFQIIKFRTMTDDRDRSGELLPDKDRITFLGRIIRKSSLDELPQLLNVIVGNMSLVGPRPLLPEYLPLYSEYQKRRHEVKPGITGWAQINGRNALSWQEKFSLDIWYVEHCNFKTDMRILIRTIGKVLTKDNVETKDSVTMEKFTGNDD